MKGKTTQNTGEYLNKPGTGKNFLNKLQNALTIKEKTNKSNNIKIKSLCASKGIINRIKRQVTKRQNIFATYIINKRFIPEYIMEPFKSVRKGQSTEKWAKRLNEHLRKEDIQMANKLYY